MTGVGTFKLVVMRELGPARAEKKIIWYPALWICVLLVIVYHHSKPLSYLSESLFPTSRF